MKTLIRIAAAAAAASMSLSAMAQGPCPPGARPSQTSPVDPLLGCSNYFHNVRPDAAPENSFTCPATDRLRFLPPTYPAGGVFISYVPGHRAGIIPDTYPPEGLMAESDNSSFITQFVSEVQSASPGTQVNIVVSSTDQAAATAALASVTSNAAVRIMVIPEHREPDPDNPGQTTNTQGVSRWMQDIMEFGVRDGHPAIMDLPVEPGRGGDTPRVIADQCSGTDGLTHAQASGAYVNPPVDPAHPEDTGPMSRLFTRTGVDMAGCSGDLIGIGTNPSDTAARTAAEGRWPACAEAHVTVATGDFHAVASGTAGSEQISAIEQARRMGVYARAHATGGMTNLDFSTVDTGCCNDSRHRRPDYSSSDFGGNLEGMPLGVVAVGEKMNRHLRDYLASEGNDVVQIQAADYLAVGHVDELFSVVPAPGTPPCNFALLRASPAEGIAAMRAQPGTTRFGDNEVECRPRVGAPNAI
ncbi:MAG TPA: protein-arginine deiminase family protein, partial [Bdellovibrionota bacterium]|nr:protein-arginine deiminase family protein [Bdellovibrionota bacterium]